jgi:hypothetical protein
MLTEHPALHGSADQCVQYSPVPALARQTGRLLFPRQNVRRRVCALFLDHCVGFVLRRTQSQHGLTTEQQGGLKGFPHYVVGIVFDQFQRMFAVKSAQRT